ncbi:type II and III secretion system protein [Alteromonas sp. 5E99-2]|uniref:secretin N-terminal domain-containing protein n=1 Tax=Alteromonas sp. 5E99-2 TaxID=2817683 RepID=UPI001A99F53E|nr:secretin N-terminal domain-containing protein [Alteromonas sp. 5E99-2]MBO1254147.1 type II and III secretion system protein [Alteromonas sp. 5E99-2]
MKKHTSMGNVLLPSALTLTLLMGLTSCATSKGPAFEAAKKDNELFNSVLRKPTPLSDGEQTLKNSTSESSDSSGLTIKATPKPTVEQSEVYAANTIVPILSDKKVSRVAFNDLTVSAFINEMYGNQLGLNFVLEPGLKSAKDLVTLRIAEPLSQRDAYRLATESLRSYGVSTSLKDNVLHFSYTGSTGNDSIPLLVSGRALPDVPSTSRSIIQLYPLKAVRAIAAKSLLVQMLPRKSIELQVDNELNTLILIGPKNIISQAIAAVQLIDRPSMENMHSAILQPTLITVTDLTNNLEKILTTEGYSVSQTKTSSAIRLLPLESSGQLIAFAQSKNILDHIIQWAKTFETEKHNSVESGLFSYQVQSTQATHIVEVLNSLGVANFTSQDTSTPISDRAAAPRTNTRSSSNPQNRNSNGSTKGKFAVDEQLNTILFSGSGKDWLQSLDVIKRLDKPAPSVLVEVVLAEVTLTDGENFGIDWLRNTTVGNSEITFGTGSGLELGTSGFNFALNNAGSTFATLNAFYQNNRANIRSRPRIMVKSGGSASIDVGNEIPIVTSNSSSVTDADALQVNSISYRNTGVILDITPTVHASGYVDIEISQELSEAADTASGIEDAPIILNRRIETTVTLRDGGSVLLGGLLSSTTSKNSTGVPVLGKLPLIGQLFRSDGNEQVRTELMIMVIPYIINSPEEAEALTDELQKARIDALTNDTVPQE